MWNSNRVFCFYIFILFCSHWWESWVSKLEKDLLFTHWVFFNFVLIEWLLIFSHWDKVPVASWWWNFDFPFVEIWMGNFTTFVFKYIRSLFDFYFFFYQLFLWSLFKFSAGRSWFLRRRLTSFRILCIIRFFFFIFQMCQFSFQNISPILNLSMS